MCCALAPEVSFSRPCRVLSAASLAAVVSVGTQRELFSQPAIVTNPITYSIAFPYVGTPCCTRKSRVCPRDDQSLCGYLETSCWASAIARLFDCSDFLGCSSVL